MALDFSGYVPGMVNIGPAYKPPTVTQEIISLRAMIEELRTQISGLDPETVARLSEAVDALEERLDELAAVAFTGSYNDLTDTPTIPAAQVNADWDATSGVAEILNKPTIPAAQVNADWDAASGVAEILNKPTIPAATSDLTNDSGYITDTDIETKANSAGASAGYAATLAAGIPFGQCDATSTATAFTATVTGITELRDGVCVLLKNGVVSSASGFTLNINGLGAKPCYTNLAAATRDTTIFHVSYTMLFIYSETIVSGGGWICYRGYDSNTNTIGYQLRTNSSRWTMAAAMYRYRLMFQSADDPAKMVPANSSTSTNATSARTPSTLPIDPFGPIIYYGYTAAISAGSRPAAAYMWTQYVVTLGYSFTVSSSLTEFAPLYLKCTPQASGGAVIDPTVPYTQTLPSAADGYIYIYLGNAVTTTTFELAELHPVYYHNGTGIRLWTGHKKAELLAAAWNISGSLSSVTLADDVSNYTELEIRVKGPYSGYANGVQVYQQRVFRVPVSEGGFAIRDFTDMAVNNIIAISWSGTTAYEQNSTSPLTTGYTVEAITAY